MLSNGAEIDKADINGQTPLIIAAKEGQLEIVKELLKKDADISKRDKAGKTSLEHAEKYGRTEIANYLRQYKKKLN